MSWLCLSVSWCSCMPSTSVARIKSDLECPRLDSVHWGQCDWQWHAFSRSHPGSIHPHLIQAQSSPFIYTILHHPTTVLLASSSDKHQLDLLWTKSKCFTKFWNKHYVTLNMYMELSNSYWNDSIILNLCRPIVLRTISVTFVGFKPASHYKLIRRSWPTHRLPTLPTI